MRSQNVHAFRPRFSPGFAGCGGLPTHGRTNRAASAILLQFCPHFLRKAGKADSGREGVGDFPQARKSPPPTGGRAICSKMCMPSARDRTRDEGRNSGFRPEFRYFLAVPHAFTPTESRVLLRTRARVLLH